MTFPTYVDHASASFQQPGRWRILWLALKHLFTGRGLTFTAGVQVCFATPGISAEYWVKQNSQPWTHWAVCFDGKAARGFINGYEIGRDI